MRAQLRSWWGAFLGVLLVAVLAGATPGPMRVTSVVGSAQIADGTVALADMADLGAATVIGRASGAGTGVPTALTGTQVNALLPVATAALAGPVQLGVDVPAMLVLANDQTESAATPTDATGLTFAPAANAAYFVEFYGIFSSSATTNGFQWGFVGAGDSYDGEVQITPASAATTLQRLGSVSGALVAGTNTVSTNPNNPAYGWAIIATAGSPPAAIKVQFQSEAAAGASVTLKKGAFLRYKRLY